MFRALFVEGIVWGENEEIVHVDDKPAFGDHIAERVVHETLEGSGGVGESKKHDGGFKQPFVGDEGCLPLVAILDSHVVVPPADVKLGENRGVS